MDGQLHVRIKVEVLGVEGYNQEISYNHTDLETVLLLEEGLLGLQQGLVQAQRAKLGKR